MEEIIIKVSLDRGEDGFAFDIYRGEDAYHADHPADGGFCTSTVENAIDMAFEAAKEVYRKSR